ncbi:MAG: hypothetical protein IKE61_05385 [Coriobacteriales bacterium]|nr:hypothetical protein [Coriobacteriales bacterium]
MQRIRIAVVQMESEIGGVDANLEKMARFVDEASEQGCSLVCFPEACLTGYSASDSDVAIASDDPRVDAAKALAEKAGIAISFGFIEAGGAEHPFVKHMVASPSQTLSYRKTHLGPYEDGAFTAGDELPVATIPGVSMGIQLCWESHIPQISATLRAKGAELIIAPFASGIGGERRLESWERFLPARASDNGVYLAACNALGYREDGRRKGGGIALYDPYGKLIASHFGSSDHILIAEIGPDLPREHPDEGMGRMSYFDRIRPELYEL